MDMFQPWDLSSSSFKMYSGQKLLCEKSNLPGKCHLWFLSSSSPVLPFLSLACSPGMLFSWVSFPICCVCESASFHPPSSHTYLCALALGSSMGRWDVQGVEFTHQTPWAVFLEDFSVSAKPSVGLCESLLLPFSVPHLTFSTVSP